MQNGTANTMLKMIVYFQKTKTIVRNKEKNIAIYKSVSSKQKQTTALQQSWRWAFKFWGAGHMSHVNWALYCLKIVE